MSSFERGLWYFAFCLLVLAVWRVGNRPLVLVGDYHEIKTAAEQLPKGRLPEAWGMGVLK